MLTLICHEIRTRPAHDARQRRRGGRQADRMVQGVRLSGRAGSCRVPQRYGDTVTVLDWRDRLVCSRCGGREIDMVVSGTKRR
jgi:hypothetical protein